MPSDSLFDGLALPQDAVPHHVVVLDLPCLCSALFERGKLDSMGQFVFIDAPGGGGVAQAHQASKTDPGNRNKVAPTKRRVET